MDAARYEIDSAMSRFTVKATAAGLLSSFGHNPTIFIRDFRGQARFTDGLESSELELHIKTSALEVTGNMSDKDRREIERTMNQEVLETDRYPEITFKASQIEAQPSGEGTYVVNLVGDLSLHGVTRSVPVLARVSFLGDTLRGNGEFSVQQTEYGIKLVSVAGGALKLKDELKCAFDILARKQA